MSTLSSSTIVAEFPVSPVSLQLATVLIQTNLEDPNVLNAVAQGLIETILKREREQVQERAELQQQIQDLQIQLDQQATGPLFEQCPKGCCLNRDGQAHQFYIPREEGLAQPMWWVKKVGDGQVARLPCYHTPDTKHFIGNIYTQPDHTDVNKGAPVLPLGVWLLQILHGPSTNFNQLEQAIETEDWGLQVNVYCYHVLHHQLQDAEARMAQLAAKICTIRGVSELSRGRLEAAQLERKVSQLCTLPARGRHQVHYYNV